MFSSRSIDEYDSRLAMYHAVVEQQREARDGWTVDEVARMPPLFSLPADVPTWIGMFSWSQPTVKHRWMLRQHVTRLAVACSPADLARGYLVCKYGKGWRGRCRTSQYDAIIKGPKRVSPHVAMPGYIQDAIYLDMQSAYWQIVMAVGWDVDYMPGKWLAAKSSNLDFPFEQIKLARNSLVTVSLPTPGKLWHGGRMHSIKARRLHNVMLWAFVQDVLHGIAADMASRCGARYVNTDGYILPASRYRDAMAVADEWGIVLRQKHAGAARIYNATNYRIGERYPSRYLRTSERTINNLVAHADRNWLKKRYRALAQRAKVSLRLRLELKEYLG